MTSVRHIFITNLTNVTEKVAYPLVLGSRELTLGKNASPMGNVIHSLPVLEFEIFETGLSRHLPTIISYPAIIKRAENWTVIA